VLLRPSVETRFRAAVLVCLAVTLLVNLGLAVLALLGALDTAIALLPRVLLLLVGAITAMLAAGVCRRYP
jgi:hypothetical protein